VSAVDGVALELPAELRAEVDRTLADWDQGRKMQRLWDRDATLWTGLEAAPRRLRGAIDQAV
jgi:transaldolase/glucose-6-phosphate isomerase